MHSRKIICVLAYIFIFSVIQGCARDESLRGESPEEVAKASLEYGYKGDWSAYARLMHPEALAEFKRKLRPIIAADMSGRIAEFFLGVKDFPQFEAMSEIAVFEEMISNSTKKFPQAAGLIKTTDYSIIGSVPEGADLVHVVYRFGVKSEQLSTVVEVISLRRYQGGWRLLLRGRIEDIATEWLQKQINN
jgi:hypothetical protein